MTRIPRFKSMIPSNKLVNLLRERGWHHDELAALADVSRTAIRSCLQNTPPRVDVAFRIADALEVDARWLWSDSPWGKRPDLPAGVPS